MAGSALQLGNRKGSERSLQLSKRASREEGEKCFYLNDLWWKPDMSRGYCIKKGHGHKAEAQPHTSGLDPEVDLAFRGVRDAVATELHIRAAGGESGEESSETQGNAQHISGNSEAQATPDLRGLRVFLK